MAPTPLLAATLALLLALPALAEEAAPTPPAKAAGLVAVALEAYGHKRDLDPDYGQVNQELLETLAQAIELVEITAPETAAEPLADELAGWRHHNRTFIKRVTRDAEALPHPAKDPLRHRVAQQALYRRILSGLRTNLAAFRRMSRTWQASSSRMGLGS